MQLKLKESVTPNESYFEGKLAIPGGGSLKGVHHGFLKIGHFQTALTPRWVNIFESKFHQNVELS